MMTHDERDTILQFLREMDNRMRTHKQFLPFSDTDTGHMVIAWMRGRVNMMLDETVEPS